MPSETPTNQPRDLDAILDAVESDLATMPPEEARLELARRVVRLQYTQTLAVAIDAIWALASELANARKQQDQHDQPATTWGASIPMNQLDITAKARDAARLELALLRAVLGENGHVVPNATGTRERCGGLAMCPKCRRDQERLDTATRAVSDADELLAEALLRTVNADEEMAE